MADVRFHVVTDGGCDIPAEMGISPHSAPLVLSFGGEQFRSDELSPAAFYARLASSPHHPTTSQPSPKAFEELYRKLADKPILSIHISEGLSGTMNSARQAAEQIPGAEVQFHDTRTLSAGQAFQVYAACMAARSGESLETARRWLEREQAASHLLFTIDTIEYLRRGGRIGGVQAVMGSLLKLKPIVYVDKGSGTYTGVGRARTFSKAVSELVDKAVERVPPDRPVRVAVPYGDNEEDARDLIERLRSVYEVHWAATVPVGPVLAVHTGPRALGLNIAAGPWPWEENRGASPR